MMSDLTTEIQKIKESNKKLYNQLMRERYGDLWKEQDGISE